MATFVLIPGAGGEASYWRWVEPHLRERGHHTVAVQLPAADENATLDDYADTVIAAVAGSADPPVLVAQSLGGFTAVRVCERIPVSSLVYVCAMIPAPGESAGAWWSNTGQPSAARAYAQAEGRDPDRFDEEEIFFHDVPEDHLAEIRQSEPPAQSSGIFTGDWAPSAPLDVPVHVIVGRYDRLFPLDFMRRVSVERLGVEPEIINTGHLPAFSRPEELARMLARYA